MAKVLLFKGILRALFGTKKVFYLLVLPNEQ